MLSSSVRAPSRKTTTSIVPTIELIAVRRRYSRQDRKSTRLNSSHSQISYAVFCLKKKKKNTTTHSKTNHQSAYQHFIAPHPTTTDQCHPLRDNDNLQYAHLSSNANTSYAPAAAD